jgi:polysaccharide biosynthesis protein PelA
MNKAFAFIGFLMILGACAPTVHPNHVYHDHQPRWAAFYAKDILPEELIHYDLLVFDGEHYPDLTPYHKKTTLLQYISIGEVHGHSPLLEPLKQQGAIWGYNKTWDSYVVNLANPLWRKTILTIEIPKAIAAGFDGIMLDTSDSYLQAKPKEKDRSIKNLVTFIKEIRNTFPGIKIMLNRGFEILPEVADDINYILAESILVDSNYKNGLSTAYPQSGYESTARLLQQTKQLSPKLKVYTLDYWNPEDADGIIRIYKKQRARGFIPYVATSDLRRHVPEPSGKQPGRKP